MNGAHLSTLRVRSEYPLSTLEEGTERVLVRDLGVYSMVLERSEYPPSTLGAGSTLEYPENPRVPSEYALCMPLSVTIYERRRTLIAALSCAGVRDFVRAQHSIAAHPKCERIPNSNKPDAMRG